MTKKQVESAQMDPMEQFLTGKHQSEAQRLQLYTPDGKISEHYLEVIGIDSKPMRKKKQVLIHEAASKIKSSEWTSEMQEALSVQLIASAVTGWSFEAECTYENVLKFLSNAPLIADAVDAFCSNHANYFGKK